ncbi:MAG: type VI secretion system baseplate subunit TssF [Gammaproteobacteria bacterium]
MDPRLLDYYNRELQHVREMGGEFAHEFPKIAGRLGIEGIECADPYVERLIESFAFLAARVRLKIDDQFPRFTQHLLEMVYPHYLAPTPSMAVVQLTPDVEAGSLENGFEVPRGTVFKSQVGKGEQTACEYRSAHDVTLWPVEIAHAEYLSSVSGLLGPGGARRGNPRAGLRLRLNTGGGLEFPAISLDTLGLYVRGPYELRMRVYEQLMGHSMGVRTRAGERSKAWQLDLPAGAMSARGYDDEDALLPFSPRSFQGYRLLQEYFCLPERFLFVDISGLQPSFQRTEGETLELIVLFDRLDPRLEGAVDESHFALHCTPVVNLFDKRTDRIHLDRRQHEYHVLPDRTRPMDFEVHTITGVAGFGSSTSDERTFKPFYAHHDRTPDAGNGAYYTVQREPRRLSSRQQRVGARTSYVGSESFVSLVDANQAPVAPDLRQLAVTAICTNRDLPLQMPLGRGKTDFTMPVSAPVASVRCIDGPTRPRHAHYAGDAAWRVVSHLSLNYLSLVNSGEEHGAAAMRALLSLYVDPNDKSNVKRIEGLASIHSRALTRRMPVPGPIAFGRGIEITLDVDESAFEGAGAHLFGAVLEQFFARYASINTFTHTIVRSIEGHEIMRWPARTGRRQTL